MAPNIASAFEITLTTDAAAKPFTKALKSTSLIYGTRSDKVTEGADILAAAQADYARFVSLLYEAGHFGPQIQITVDGREAALIPPFEPLRTVSTVDISITAGTSFRLGHTRIGPLATGTVLPEGFRRNQPASISIIQNTTDTAINAWRAIGHAKADVAGQKITARHNDATLSVDMTLSPGPQLRFGKLIIKDPSYVRESRIRKIVALPSGDVFDPKEVDRAVKRMRRTGAFSLVTLQEADTANPDGTLDMDLNVSDPKPRRFGFGAELETSQGINLNAFWMHRNLFGGAEKLILEGEVKGLGGSAGQEDIIARALFSRPATFSADTDMTIGFALAQKNEQLYALDHGQFSIGLTRSFSDTLGASIALETTRSQITDDFGTRNMSTFAIPVSVTWDRRNDIRNATSGTYVMAEITPYLGFDRGANGLRAYADARAYQAVGANDQVVFAGRIQVGSIVGSSIEQTSPDMLFLSGGGNTVRGQPYQSNSVLTATTETGGLSFVGVSAEARLKLTRGFSTVAFYDVGYIGDASFAGGAGSWHAGAGIGMRYDTGIGPIRVDLGFPVYGPGDSGMQLYIGIGQAF